MTDDDKTDMTVLEDMFDAARATPPEVPPALLARVAADAEALQPKRSGWRTWMATLGGVPGLGGLVTASCVGFWLGVAPPEGVPDLAATVLGQQVVLDEDVTSGTLDAFGWDLEEG